MENLVYAPGLVYLYIRVGLRTNYWEAICNNGSTCIGRSDMAVVINGVVCDTVYMYIYIYIYIIYWLQRHHHICGLGGCPCHCAVTCPLAHQSLAGPA